MESKWWLKSNILYVFMVWIYYFILFSLLLIEYLTRYWVLHRDVYVYVNTVLHEKILHNMLHKSFSNSN